MKTLNGSSQVSTALENAASQPAQSSSIHTPYGRMFSIGAAEKNRSAERINNSLEVTGASEYLAAVRNERKALKSLEQARAFLSTDSNSLSAFDTTVQALLNK